MTAPIEHADLSDLIQRCLEADETLALIADGSRPDRLRVSAVIARASLKHVLWELRRIARETGDQT